MSPLANKQQFHNETGGWLGVVALNAKGEEVGVSVPPDGYVFLSEEEQRLTASAPRDPKDNPFVPQEFETIDPQSGRRKTIMRTPLVASQDDRYTPGVERPIPADMAGGATGAALAAHAATTGDTLVVEGEGDEKPAAPSSAPDSQEPPPVPPRAAAAAAAAQEPPPEPAPPATPPAAEPVPDETASTGPLGGVEVGRSQVDQTEFSQSEETGAAAEPQGDAVEGSFAPGEEVGTPDSSSAVAAGPEGEPDEEQAPPPPFNPGE